MLSLLCVYALTQWHRVPSVSGAMMAAGLIGQILVLFPDTTTAIANILGVGRGADLIFYIFIVITIAAIFNVHLRIRSNNEALTQIARSIAIETARRPKMEL